MEPNARIYIAGHRGLVGSALLRTLQKRGYTNLLTRSHAELDLTDQGAVNAFFGAERPDYVFVAAARVGGILANHNYPAEFIRDNLALQINVIHEAWKSGVKRLLFLGSSCIYPKHAPQPIREEYLLTGPLEPTNRPYAVAKIAGIEMCWSYNRQYATRFLAVMPCNLYGQGDNYHPENSHVIPALIRKFHEAKVQGLPTVTVLGTGMPRREFLDSEDLADACVLLMNLPDAQFDAFLGGGQGDVFMPPLVNIGAGVDITIRDLAETIRDALDYTGEIVFDSSKPDGTPRKLLDSSRIRALGWTPRVSLHQGIAKAYRDFLTRYASNAL